MTLIRDVRVELFERRMPHSTAAPRFAGGSDVDCQALIAIRNEDGVVGECLVGGPSRRAVELLADEVASFLADELVGRTSADRGWVLTQLPAYVHYGRASRQAWAAVDVALWDLAGKEVATPVCELLGAVRAELPMYISSGYHEELDEYAAEALAWRERGVTAYKPHPGGRPADAVIELARSVRDAVGDGMALILDASLFYELEDALAIGRHLEELRYLWFEDPMPWAHEQGFAALGRRLDIPLAATDYVGADVADVVNRARRDPGLRILRAGSRDLGITGLVRAAAVAEALGRRCELHVNSTVHTNVANLHVALSSSASGWFEMVGPFDWVQWGTIERIEPDGAGRVRALAAPGLGVELDRELLAHSRIA